MTKKKKSALVIVESPTKARTLSKILGSDYEVVSSMGHLIDLPAKKIGVDIDKNFQPSYVVIPGRAKILTDLKKSADKKDEVYIATDPDREGEAIGWQIKMRLLKKDKKKIWRVVFHEITPEAIKAAFKKPHDFNQDMVNAQAGRRILDRIVGYFLSPLLWRKIARGLSAGRVQSVALRIIVDREKEIEKFQAEEYWEIEAELKKKAGIKAFLAKLSKIDGVEAKIKNQEEANRLTEDIRQKTFKVSDIREKEVNKYPQAPFITSTLQQEAFNKLRFNVAKTMIVAQQLYEGIELGKSGMAGLITYMRTDSTQVAKEAISEVRGYIQKNFGQGYLPAQPNVYKVRKTAQEAHEAIRPASVKRDPESIKQFLSDEQFKLYELIYKRFVASQMTPARYLAKTVDINAEQYLFTANGRTVIFDGFTKIYKDEDKDEDKKTLPKLEKEEILDLVNLTPSQHFTKPPARFSESSLVKALEEYGIGRPSTYAPIIQTIVMRDYVRRIKGYFQPTELGVKVCEMLVEYFADVMDFKFTARMEDELDEVEEGKLEYTHILKEFYAPFKKDLDFAQENIKKEVITTNEICDKCGKPMIIKWGRKGKFLSCSAYPDCKNAKSITSGVKCPQEGCGGELIERRSRRGFFYGCSHYPKCTFTSRTLPESKVS